MSSAPDSTADGTAVTVAFPYATAHSATGHTAHVTVGLTWRATRPLQVDVALAHAGQRHDWLIARDLLTAGLTGPAGDGDVSVFPDLPADGHRVELVLRNYTGIGHNLAIVLPVAALRRFLADTHQQVPAGTEVCEFDIAELDRETS